MIVGTTYSDVKFIRRHDGKLEKLTAPLLPLDGVDPDDRAALESWAASKIGVFVNRETNEAAVVVWEGA